MLFILSHCPILYFDAYTKAYYVIPDEKKMAASLHAN